MLCTFSKVVSYKFDIKICLDFSYVVMIGDSSDPNWYQGGWIPREMILGREVRKLFYSEELLE